MPFYYFIRLGYWLLHICASLLTWMRGIGGERKVEHSTCQRLQCDELEIPIYSPMASRNPPSFHTYCTSCPTLEPFRRDTGICIFASLGSTAGVVCWALNGLTHEGSALCIESHCRPCLCHTDRISAVADGERHSTAPDLESMGKLKWLYGIERERIAMKLWSITGIQRLFRVGRNCFYPQSIR